MSNVYYKTYYQETLTLRDGRSYNIFKTVSDVKENGVSLTEQTSVDDVESNPGSWYQNIGSEIVSIYIHFSNSSNGADKTLAAYFNMYFASENIIFNNIFYEGRLNNISPVSHKIPFIFWGTSEIEGGDISLNNADGFFDTLSEKFIWENKNIIIKIGSDLMNYSDFLTLFTGQIRNKTNSDENNFVLKYFSKKIALSKVILTDYFNVTSYPNLEQRAIGQPIPKSWGIPFDTLAEAPLLWCINTKYGSSETASTTAQAGTTTTKIIIPNTFTNYNIENYYKGHYISYGGALYKVTAHRGSSSELTTETIAGMAEGESFTLLKYNQQQYYVPASALSTVYVDYGDGLGWRAATASALSSNTFVITTPLDGAQSGFQEGTTKVKALFTPSVFTDGNMSDIIKDLCQTEAGLVDADLNLTSFSTSQTDTDIPIQIYQNKQEQTIIIIGRILASSAFDLFYTGIDGKINYKAWNPQRITVYDEFEDYEYFDFNVKSWGDDLRNTISIGYNKNYETDKYSYVSENNSKSEYLYDERPSQIIDTYIVSKTIAQTVAQRILYIINEPGRQIKFKTHLRPVQKNIGDKIYVTKTKSPDSENGGMNLVLAEITGISRDIQNNMVEIECSDLRGYGFNVGIWVSTGTPAYKDATNEQRSVSGYWTQNGFADVTDPNSYGISRWW